MKYLFLSLLTFILVLIQTSLPGFLALRGAWPNLLLITIVSLYLTKKSKASFLFAVLGGVFLDFSTLTTFGSSSLLFCILVILCSFYIRLFGGRFFQRIFLGFLISVISRIGFLIINQPFFGSLTPFSTILLGGLLDAFGLIIAYPFIVWIIKIFLPKDEMQLSFRDRL